MPPPSINASSANFWNLKPEDALKGLSCSEKGLSSAEAGARLQQYGLNTFKARSRSSSIILLLLQFKSPITLLLIGAALLSMGLGDFTDAIIILIIILVSSFLGFWQEKGAANAVAELLTTLLLYNDSDPNTSNPFAYVPQEEYPSNNSSAYRQRRRMSVAPNVAKSYRIRSLLRRGNLSPQMGLTLYGQVRGR